MQVLPFSGGAEALHHLATCMVLPDLVLLDCMMPVMDGFEVLRRLRAMSQSMHLPVIMVSARVSVLHSSYCLSRCCVVQPGHVSEHILSHRHSVCLHGCAARWLCVALLYAQSMHLAVIMVFVHVNLLHPFSLPCYIAVLR
eukprot:743168-Pelagomonas_calceolata.AAC.7